MLAVVAVTSLLGFAGAQSAAGTGSAPTQFNEFTVAQFQSLFASGGLNSVTLTNYYIQRIQSLDQEGPDVNSVIELNPDAVAEAQVADQRRAQHRTLGPLDGIPVLLKANIDTGDRMQTTAGSFALQGTPAAQDSTVAANLRAGGAVILGKTNLSEWANFRSFESTSGWSGVGGQTNNPYGIARNPCGSSSGSGAAASANFAAGSLGTETDGSVVCPANANGVVGLKPTIGLTSRAGVVPISHTQDTVGIHARTVADAAATLGVIQSAGFDGRDDATGGVPLGWQGTGRTRPKLPSDYTRFLSSSGLQGARIGVTRLGLGGFDPLAPPPQAVLNAVYQFFASLQHAGATVVDLDAAGFTGFGSGGGPGEFLVLCFEFRNDVQKYLATRTGVPAAGGTLKTLIDFDASHAAQEMPFFNDDIFQFCNSLETGADTPQPAFGGLTYNQALQQDQAFGQQGIDAALKQFNLDAVVSATDNPAWETDLLYADRFFFGTSSLAAAEGYPILQVPAGMVDGVPFGISFFGTAFSEPELIKLASGYEAATKVRAGNLPTFAANAPFTNIQGTTLVKPAGHSFPMAKQPDRKQPHHL